MSIDEYVQTSDALFHYTKTSIVIEHILHAKKFKLSLLKDTNDPREYKFKIFNTAGISLDPTVTRELSNKAQTVIDRILRCEYRVMSFCSNQKPTLILSDGNSVEDVHYYSQGWDKSRMWSQYGENHRGICLVFSKEELKKTFDERQVQIKKHEANYVKYLQQDGFDWGTGTLDGNRLESEGVEAYLFNHIMENSEGFFFRKHIDYRDEAEFRVVVFDPEKKLECIDISTSLKGVIVGDRTPEPYIPLINKMCKDIKVESRKAYWSRGKLHLLTCE